MGMDYKLFVNRVGKVMVFFFKFVMMLVILSLVWGVGGGGGMVSKLNFYIIFFEFVIV